MPITSQTHSYSSPPAFGQNEPQGASFDVSLTRGNTDFRSVSGAPRAGYDSSGGHSRAELNDRASRNMEARQESASARLILSAELEVMDQQRERELTASRSSAPLANKADSAGRPIQAHGLSTRAIGRTDTTTDSNRVVHLKSKIHWIELARPLLITLGFSSHKNKISLYRESLAFLIRGTPVDAYLEELCKMPRRPGDLPGVTKTLIGKINETNTQILTSIANEKHASTGEHTGSHFRTGNSRGDSVYSPDSTPEKTASRFDDANKVKQRLERQLHGLDLEVSRLNDSVKRNEQQIRNLEGADVATSPETSQGALASPSKQRLERQLAGLDRQARQLNVLLHKAGQQIKNLANDPGEAALSQTEQSTSPAQAAPVDQATGTRLHRRQAASGRRPAPEPPINPAAAAPGRGHHASYLLTGKTAGGLMPSSDSITENASLRARATGQAPGRTKKRDLIASKSSASTAGAGRAERLALAHDINSRATAKTGATPDSNRVARLKSVLHAIEEARHLILYLAFSACRSEIPQFRESLASVVHNAPLTAYLDELYRTPRRPGDLSEVTRTLSGKINETQDKILTDIALAKRASASKGTEPHIKTEKPGGKSMRSSVSAPKSERTAYLKSKLLLLSSMEQNALKLALPAFKDTIPFFRANHATLIEGTPLDAYLKEIHSSPSSHGSVTKIQETLRQQISDMKKETLTALDGFELKTSQSGDAAEESGTRKATADKKERTHSPGDAPANRTDDPSPQARVERLRKAIHEARTSRYEDEKDGRVFV